MSDARRRELERDVARGEPGAPMALVRERLRAGELTGEPLRVAVHLDAPLDDEPWFKALATFSEDVALRAVLAAVTLSTSFQVALAAPGARLERGVLRGFAWLAVGCRVEHLQDAGARARSIAAQQGAFADRYGAGAGLTLQAGPGCRCASAGVATLDARLLLERLTDPLAVPWLSDVDGLTAGRVRAELTADLLGWVLEA